MDKELDDEFFPQYENASERIQDNRVPRHIKVYNTWLEAQYKITKRQRLLDQARLIHHLEQEKHDKLTNRLFKKYVKAVENNEFAARN